MKGAFAKLKRYFMLLHKSRGDYEKNNRSFAKSSLIFWCI